MPVAGIISAWPSTKDVFVKYGIDTNTNSSLDQIISDNKLESLVDELNNTINSSDVTCIEGG